MVEAGGSNDTPLLITRNLLKKRDAQNAITALSQVRHDTVEKQANPFRISLGSGKVCTTFGIGFQPFWNA